MNRRALPVALLTLGGWILACAAGPPEEGDDRSLEGDPGTDDDPDDDYCGYTGAIVADEARGAGLVMLTELPADCADIQASTPTFKTLFSVDPERDGPEGLADLDGHDTVRVLPMDAGVVVLSEVDGAHRLQLLDPSGGVRWTHETDRALENSRVSPGGTLLLSERDPSGSVGNGGGQAVFVFDPAGGGVQQVSNGAEVTTAGWLGTDDRLVVATHVEDGPSTTVRVYDLSSGIAGGLPQPELVETIEGLRHADGGILPPTASDVGAARIALPVRAPVEDTVYAESLLVVDADLGELMVVPAVGGPPAWPRQGESLMGADPFEGLLIKVDPSDGSLLDAVESPFNELDYALTPVNQNVLVGVSDGEVVLRLLRARPFTLTTLGDRALALGALAWTVEGGDEVAWGLSDGLVRVSLSDAAVDDVALDFEPGAVASLGPDGPLLIGDRGPARVVVRTTDGVETAAFGFPRAPWARWDDDVPTILGE